MEVQAVVLFMLLCIWKMNCLNAYTSVFTDVEFCLSLSPSLIDWNFQHFSQATDSPFAQPINRPAIRAVQWDSNRVYTSYKSPKSPAGFPTVPTVKPLV